jgi:hypothetical protein
MTVSSFAALAAAHGVDLRESDGYARRLLGEKHLPGQHSQATHGGGGVGPGADDDDEDEGEFGFGVDSAGVSYTENDVDDAGNPRFSESYRRRYGPINSETIHDTAEGRPIAIVQSEKGPFMHVADDSAGTRGRVVVQEFTQPQTKALGDGVWSVYNGDKESATVAGVSIKPAGANPTRDGVQITWSGGLQTTFEGESGNDEAFDLQESLGLS